MVSFRVGPMITLPCCRYVSIARSTDPLSTLMATYSKAWIGLQPMLSMLRRVGFLWAQAVSAPDEAHPETGKTPIAGGVSWGGAEGI